MVRCTSKHPRAPYVHLPPPHPLGSPHEHILKSWGLRAAEEHWRPDGYRDFSRPIEGACECELADEAWARHGRLALVTAPRDMGLRAALARFVLVGAVLVAALTSLSPVRGPPAAVACYRVAAVLLAVFNGAALGLPRGPPGRRRLALLLLPFGLVLLAAYVWWRGSPWLSPRPPPLSLLVQLAAGTLLATWAERTGRCLTYATGLALAQTAGMYLLRL